MRLDLYVEECPGLLGGLYHALCEALHVALEGGQWGAQLVGDVGDHIHPPPLGLLQCPRHSVEALRELSQLVGLAYRHALLVAPGSDAGRIQHVPQRVHDPPGHKEAGHGSCHRSRQACEE